ncbi:MAG: hypothetical protein U0U69_13535 [Acidimicrobiia bacterium]
MRFHVEPWAPEYGSPVEDAALAQSTANVDAGIEVEPQRWGPIAPAAAPIADVLFVDGVRRIDAHVWIDTDDESTSRHGICASYAAGAVRCNGKAEVVAARVCRRLFTAATEAEDLETRWGAYTVHTAQGDTVETLSLAVQAEMGALEGLVAAEAGAADLVVLDGPLGRRGHVAGALGYVKTHHSAYLPAECQRVLGDLNPGERTPLFLIESGGRSLFSWYVRLPGETGGSPLSGRVRCETVADRSTTEVSSLADAVAATVVRFASRSHREPRAPQNLYPIAGLEAQLRRRLGDREILYRALRSAAPL